MAYTPNEWGVGNLITASKMNKIERQLVENTSDLDDIRNGVTVPTYEEFETLRDDVAAEYDNTKTYSVGDYVIYNTQLYKCKTAITSAETWTAAHWDTVEVGEELQRIEGKNEEEVAELKSAIKDLNSFDLLRGNHSTNDYSGNNTFWTWSGEVCTVTTDGQASAGTIYNLYQNRNGFPSWLSPGQTVYIKYSAEVVKFAIYKYIDDTLITTPVLDTTNYDGLITIPSDATGIVIRFRVAKDSTANESVSVTFASYESNQKLQIDSISIKNDVSRAVLQASSKDFTSCDDIPTNRVLFVSSNGGVLDIPDFPFNKPGTLVSMGGANFPVQFAFRWDTSPIQIKSRSKGSSGWTVWVDYSTPDEIDSRITTLESKAVLSNGWANSSGITSCDDITGPGWYAVSSSGGVPSPSDFPFNGAGWIMTIPQGDNFALQVAFSFTAGMIKARIKNTTWSSWVDTGGRSETITITQEVSRDTYNNSYDITVSPSITTDSNGWIQPVDTDTADETGKTDMTGAIMAMLNSTGYCHLAPGIYYVSGNIDMPTDSMLEGCGKQTIIRLLQSTTSGYIVRMHTRSTIKNVCFSGGYANGDISNGNIGGRKGVNFIGNRDGQDAGVTPSACTLCQIEGCWFENLDSGIYGYNAGGGLQQGMEVSNCYFTRCKAGINFDYWTEYSKFVNCVTFRCYYGCINNGGNNVFMNCTFHAVIGFLIDNSSGTKQNNAHGSAIGCTFNHIDNMNNPSELGQGIGIKVLNATAGFIFANCQLWFGRIHIEDSTGVQITGCEFGGLSSSYPVIETSGDGMVFIDNCLFKIAPTLSLSSPTKVTNCWTYDGVAVNA